MQLNIKNDEAHALAQELAALTGESLTAAATEALRERLERVKRAKSDRFVDLRAIARDCARRLKASPTMIQVDDLYDERGLPK